VSPLAVVNLALARVNSTTLTSLTENRKEAAVAGAAYDLLRTALLREFNWQFSLRRASLAPEVNPPEFGFQFSYLKPTDCLRFIGAFEDPEDSRVTMTPRTFAFRFEGNRVLADKNPLLMLYVADVTNVADMDPMFVDVLTWRLAAEFSLSLAADKSGFQNMWELYERRLRKARQTGSIEQPGEVITTDNRFGVDGMVGYGFTGRNPARI